MYSTCNKYVAISCKTQLYDTWPCSNKNSLSQKQMIICLEANWIGSKNYIIGSKNYIIASKPIFLYVRIPDLNRPDPYLTHLWNPILLVKAQVLTVKSPRSLYTKTTLDLYQCSLGSIYNRAWNSMKFPFLFWFNHPPGQTRTGSSGNPSALNEWIAQTRHLGVAIDRHFGNHPQLQEKENCPSQGSSPIHVIFTFLMFIPKEISAKPFFWVHGTLGGVLKWGYPKMLGLYRKNPI